MMRTVHFGLLWLLPIMIWSLFPHRAAMGQRSGRQILPGQGQVSGPFRSVAVSKASSSRWGQPEYLVGVYYFSGWWPEQPNKYYVNGRDWRTEFPGRIATLGEYNTQQTMNQEIAAAARHGIDFFQFLWYFRKEGTSSPSPDDKLNAGIEQFMASPYRAGMNFTAEHVNHPPFGIKDESDWAITCKQWCQWMKHPSYLRIDGRPMFKIHGLHHFLKDCGDDTAKVSDRIARFRRIAEEMGVGNPLIGAGVMAEPVPTGPLVAPFDFLTTYMDMPNRPRQEQPYPYSELIDFAEQAWERYSAGSEKPYIPYVPAGWDPRPWGDPRPSFAMPTVDQWRDALERAKKALDDHPRLGVPTASGGRQKMLLIYAWNEYGEGGIVAPIRGESDRKLRVIEAAFGVGASRKSSSRPASSATQGSQTR